MALTANELAQADAHRQKVAEKLEQQRKEARSQPPEKKLDRLRQLIRMAPTEQRIGPRNRGLDPALQDSHFLCCTIDLRKVEQILGEKP